MNLEKRKILKNSFFLIQFNFCSLICMLHSRQNNTKIKHSHKRCWQLIHNDKLLEKDKSVSGHQKHSEPCYRDVWDKTQPVSWNFYWYLCTNYKAVQLQAKLRFGDTSCEHSLSFSWKHLLIRSQNLGIVPVKKNSFKR